MRKVEVSSEYPSAENIGVEKIICNIVANPNIRYIVLCGPESPGHLTGEALIALLENGTDQRKRILVLLSGKAYSVSVLRLV